MISPQRHELWLQTQRRGSLSLAQLLQRLRHLLSCHIVIKRGNGDVSAVYDLGPVFVGVDTCSLVEGPVADLSC